MFGSSLGGRDAARVGVYRHSLVRRMIALLPPLGIGPGWSALSVTLCMLLMSWDAAPTLAQRFEAARATLDAALPRRRRTGRTYQGLVKALTRRGGPLLHLLSAHLRVLTERAAGKRWRFGEFVPIGADGSEFDAPRTLANEPLGFAGKDKCAPQMMTLLLVHLGAMLPWASKIGDATTPERTLLRRSLKLLPKNTLLVADAGFTGFDLLHELQRRGVSFLVRVGGGVRLLTELGYYRREGKHTVYLWPDAARSRPPLVLRLIRVGSVYLITDVTDPRRLSFTAAAELYRRRWGLEVAFRSLKQTLARRKMRSGAAANARAELAWSIAGLWVLALMGVNAIGAAGHAPRRLSLAATLSAVRWARLGHPPDRALAGRLRRAVLDTYRRGGSKKAWDRANKKHQRPPGPPRITTATPLQIRRVRELHALRQAA